MRFISSLILLSCLGVAVSVPSTASRQHLNDAFVAFIGEPGRPEEGIPFSTSTNLEKARARALDVAAVKRLFVAPLYLAGVPQTKVAKAAEQFVAKEKELSAAVKSSKFYKEYSAALTGAELNANALNEAVAGVVREDTIKDLAQKTQPFFKDVIGIERDKKVSKLHLYLH